MLKKCWAITINQNKLFHFLLCILITPLQSWALFEEVFSAKNEIVVNRSTSLKINSNFPSGCFDDIGLVSREDCFPKNTLWLIGDRQKSNFSNLVKYWTDVFVYFVKLSTENYLKDLNNDGTLEFAIYPMIAGNNPITDAYIYSISKNELVFYGMGRFHYESGPYVKNIKKGIWIEPSP